MVVTINAVNYGQVGGVTEALPPGFSYLSNSLDTLQGSVTGQSVRFTLQGDTSFTYTVTASSAAGPHIFSGTLRDFDRGNTPVGGDSSVTVEATQPVGTDPSATRSFDQATVAPGGVVVVTIAAANYGSLGAVTETLPAGFSYESSSLTDEGEVFVDGQTIKFILQGADKTFTYTVTASNTAGGHDFSGVLRDSDRDDHTVGGDDSVTVLGPRATRSFSPMSVRPSG